jgi:hypothetical protein
VLYVGQAEEMVTFAYNVKVMRKHSEGSEFVSSHKDNLSEIEREDNVAKIPFRVSSGGTARTTTLKYYIAYFLTRS